MTDDEQALLGSSPAPRDTQFVSNHDDQSRSSRLPETVVYVNDDTTSRIRFSYLDAVLELLRLSRDTVTGWLLYGFLGVRRFLQYVSPAGTLSSSPEPEAFLYSQLLFCLPFLILLLLKLAPKIIPFLLDITGASLMFIYCDNVLSSLSLTSVFRGLRVLIFAAIVIGGDVVLLGRDVYTVLSFRTIPESTESSLYVAYKVFMAGMALKLFFVGIKALVYLKFPSHLEAAQRLKTSYWIECCSHVYQFAIPIPQWFQFFSHSDGTIYYKCYSVFLAVVYILIKFYSFQKIWRNWLSSTMLLLSPPLFRNINCGEIERDVHCVICISPFKCPVKLRCSHIFCRPCIEKWFLQHNTCPVCRTIIFLDEPKPQNYTHDSSFVPIII